MISLIVGDITLPKCDTIINPTNKYGIATTQCSKSIIDYAGENLEKEIEATTELLKGKLLVGDFFVTKPYRLKRRGVKKIYHYILTEYPDGLFSISRLKEKLSLLVKDSFKNNTESIAIPPYGFYQIGIEKSIIEIIMLDIIREFINKGNLSVIDSDRDFIKRLQSVLEKSKITHIVKDNLEEK